MSHKFGALCDLPPELADDEEIARIAAPLRLVALHRAAIQADSLEEFSRSL